MLPNVRNVADAAYRLDRDERTWVRGLVDALRPALDNGLGMAACAYESRRALSRNRSFVCTGDPAFEAAVRALHGPDGIEGGARVYLRPRSGWSDEGRVRCRSVPRRSASDHHPLSTVAEMVGLVANDAPGTGVMFAAPLPEPKRVEPREGAQWRRAAAHVAAGLRLRRFIGLDADGACVQADADDPWVDEAGTELADGARNRLRSAARRIDRAGGRTCSPDGDDAERVWHELTTGGWSVVDRFDADGRRFLVARRNRPTANGTAGLTLREGQVVAYAACGHSNKWIAYALGLSTTTVSMYLGTAMRKLGLRSGVDLVSLLSSMASPGAGRPGCEAS